MDSEYNFFQIDKPASIGKNWKGGVSMRSPGAKKSNFGSLNEGPRRSENYDLTVFTGAGADTMNPQKEVGVGFGTDRGEYNYNPYELGSTVLKMLNDKLLMTGLGDVEKAQRDVSDKKEASADGMLINKNYPSEGWSTFGKKYDKKKPYQGGLL